MARLAGREQGTVLSSRFKPHLVDGGGSKSRICVPGSGLAAQFAVVL